MSDRPAIAREVATFRRGLVYGRVLQVERIKRIRRTLVIAPTKEELATAPTFQPDEFVDVLMAIHGGAAIIDYFQGQIDATALKR
jgi:hypothetical protein